MYIPTNPAARLAAYKVKAQAEAERFPAHNTSLNWRDVRRWNKPDILKSSALETSIDKKIIWLSDLDQGPFKNEGDAEKIIRLDYRGWYTDNEEQETLIGAVVSVRHAHKLDEDGAHRVYMPACYHSDWDITRVYREFYDCKEEAAGAADHYAEREAEQERDYQAKYAAQQEIIRLREELHDLNKTTLRLIKDSKQHSKAMGLPESICSLIKSTIRAAVEQRTRTFERIEALTDNYWVAVDNY